MTTRQSTETVIDANLTLGHYWRDLWRYRGLFYFLAWRDLVVRYKQTAIGVAWSVLRPFLAMVVLTVIFGKVAKLPAGGAPYPVLVYAAMLPWQFFANTFTVGSGSLVENNRLVSKVYFPRVILPVGSMIVSGVDFLISCTILGGLMVWYGFAPDWKVVFLPLFLLLAMVASMGAGLWVSALNVKYRDFRYIVPFIVQFGLYISPVGFSSSVIPDRWRLVYSINPMVGVIDGFRWAIMGGTSKLYLPGFVLSIVLATVVLVTGFGYFRSTEHTFADVI